MIDQHLDCRCPLCRIADALEKLVPANTPEPLPVADTSLKPRCPQCQGSGLYGKSLRGFCDCQTGKELEHHEKRFGHLKV
jgi:hypothetical protein